LLSACQVDHHECARCDTRFVPGTAPAPPPEDDIPEVLPAPARHQRAPRGRAPVRLGLVLAIRIPLGLVATCAPYAVGASVGSSHLPQWANNAACPHGFTEAYIDYDCYAMPQMLAATRGCSMCGKSSES
jgi:hypothetical protein